MGVLCGGAIVSVLPRGAIVRVLFTIMIEVLRCGIHVWERGLPSTRMSSRGRNVAVYRYEYDTVVGGACCWSVTCALFAVYCFFVSMH